MSHSSWNGMAFVFVFVFVERGDCVSVLASGSPCDRG